MIISSKVTLDSGTVIAVSLDKDDNDIFLSSNDDHISYLNKNDFKILIELLTSSYRMIISEENK